MRRLIKALAIMSCAAVAVSLIIISFVSAEEFTVGENLTLGVTNATTGAIITTAACNITVSNSSGTLIDGEFMDSAGDGSYNWTIDGIEASLTEKYMAKANCSVAGNEWTTWSYFNLVDIYSFDKIDDMPTDVWEFGDRNLTFVQFPAAAPISIDFSASGLFNRTFFYIEVGHIFGEIVPEMDSSFQSEYYQKIVFDLGEIPTNITNGYLIYWAKKAGNPTGELGIAYNNSAETNISVIDASTLTTSLQKFIFQFDSTNITSQYVEIIFKGQSGWTAANNVLLGMGEIPATNSYGSSDEGTTWAHVVNELAVGFVVEFNQSSFLEQLLDGGISTMDREDVWDTAPRNLTYTNNSDVNLTQGAFDTITTEVWAATTRTLTSFGTLIADIWTYATRTLTNWAEIPALVWNNTEGRNLTYVSITNATQQAQLENVTGEDVTIVNDNSTLNIILPAEAI